MAVRAHAGRAALRSLFLFTFALLLLGILALPVRSALAAKPSVVRELTKLRSESATVYELSDGSLRGEFSSAPIRFRDASGAWQSFDTSLRQSGLPGVYEAARLPLRVRIGATGTDSPPVELCAEGYTVRLQLAESTVGLALPLSGSQASYAGVAPYTTLCYRALPFGVEQSLILSGAEAPCSYTCTLTHPGLSLARDLAGQWGLYAPKQKDPLFVLSDLCVFDSARQPAFCGEAAMGVNPGKGKSSLTYRLPRRWLSDPARVFPVIIDPTLTRRTAAGNSGYCDTCVSSQGGDSHGPAPNLLTGKDSSGYYWRSLAKFDTSVIKDGAYIKEATFSLRKYDQGSQTATAYLRPMWRPWSGGSTWDSLEMSVSSFPVSWTDSSSVTAPAWLSFDARSIVQSWKDGSRTDYGFAVNQNESGSQGSTYFSWYRSADYSEPTAAPKLVVTYDPGPVAAVTTSGSAVSWGDTVSVTVKANTFYFADVKWIQMGLNLGSVDGDPTAWRGVLGWFRNASLLPSARWVTDGTLPDNSVIAHYSYSASPSDYGANAISVNFAGCSAGSTPGTTSAPGYRRATFSFTINQAFGSLASVTPDTRFALGSPTGAPTWASDSVLVSNWLDGELPQTPTSLGFTAQPGASFAVLDTAVDTLTYRTQAGQWYNAAAGANDTDGAGRGAATLLWPALADADGYHIYANDGSGGYRQVGATLGGSATVWSSAGAAFYPSDSEIAALPNPANPFWRAATPTDGAGAGAVTTPSSQLGSITPSPALAGAGVVLSDGAYLYVHARSGCAGPTFWTKIGSGCGGTLAGQTYGTVGADLGSNRARSGFLLDGVLYNGRATSISPVTFAGVRISDGGAVNLTFPAGSPTPLDCATGASITSTSERLLLASATDAESQTHIYSLAYTLSTNGDGSPRYDGYRILDYDEAGNKLGDHTIGQTTGSSEQISGVLADGRFLYLIAWPGGVESDGAHLIKISTESWRIVNQWAIKQAVTHALSGCYDATNDCFWLGAKDANAIYRYRGAGGTQSGLELRDNPNPLYAQTAGSAQGAIGEWTAYDFLVVPFIDSGGVSSEQTPDNPAAYRVAATLDKRTYTLNEDPAHTTADLASWAEHEVSVRLDAGGALAVETSDLAIDTYGPPAEISRTYLASSESSGGAFAPRWRFSFEAHLDLTYAATPDPADPNGNCTIDYYDEAGDRHHFIKTGSTWTAANGFLGSLALAQSGDWTITYPEGLIETFTPSGSRGLLKSQADRNANTTSYTWSNDQLTSITAANGQSIGVTMSGGVIAAASYATAAGTRTVTYTTASPWQVTYNAGSPLACTLTYGYDGSSRLTSITQADWPTSGQSSAETFLYSDSGALSEVRFPDYDATNKPDARATIAYGEQEATITRYGTVNGLANQPTQIETNTWSGQSGAQISQVLQSGSQERCSTTQFAYAANGQLAGALTLSEDATNKTSQLIAACDAAGNITAYSEGEVGITTAAYEDQANPSLPTVINDPDQRIVRNSYDAHGNLTRCWQQLTGGGEFAVTETSYDSAGRVTQTKELISGTVNPDSGAVSNGVWAQTDFANFAANGEPQSTTHRAVRLSYGGAEQDLTEQATYDAFGNLLSRRDLGNRLIETNTYDLAGRLLTSADALGTITHHVYDVLGYETETWRSAAGTNVKADWRTSTYDAAGRELVCTTKLSDASGNPTTQDVTTTTYDGAGSRLSRQSSTLGGQAERSTYDDHGNLTAYWEGGVYDYAAARSSRKSYDAQSQLLSEIAPGESNPTSYLYNADGRLARQTNADGSWLAFAYDANGNITSETKPKSGYGSDPAQIARTTHSYDLGNRRISTTEPSTLETSYAYDALSRQIGAQGGAQPTNTTYNTLGWVLRKVDADGVTNSKSYDAHGCLTSETVGSRTTTFTYDANDQLLSKTDADGNLLSNTYDAFGNLTRTTHKNASQTLLADISTSYDSLGRPTSSQDAVSGLSESFSYPQNQATGTQESLEYDATPLTSVTATANGREQESSRVATIGTGNTLTRTVADSTAGRDAADRWIAASLQQTGYPQLSMGRSFNAAGRLASAFGAGYTSGNSATVSYDADTAKKSAESLPLLLGGSVSASYAYNAAGQLASATVGGIAGSYTFDSLGNLTTSTEGGATTAFTYNAAKQLTQSTLGGVTTLYGWDTTNAWRTSQGPSGNPSQIQYAYNAAGRLASYANSASATSASYAYDAAGQRRASTVTISGATTTTTYLYDEITLLSLSATQGESSWRIDYLSDEEGTPYAGIYRSPASSTSPVVFVMVTSSRGDVVELLDANGDAFAAYHYDAWGKPVGAGNYATGIWTQNTSLVNATLAGQIASRQILRYASYAYDAESGLYYCSARYYDPTTRQFTTADSAKADGEESPFQYCSGDPVNRTDPNGLFWGSIWKGVKKAGKAAWGGVKTAGRAIGSAAKSAAVYAYRHPLDTALNVASFIPIPGAQQLAWAARGARAVSAAVKATRVFRAVRAGRTLTSVARGVGAKIASRGTGRVFWSGGDAVKTYAASRAKAEGKKTLEMTLRGRTLEKMNKVVPRESRVSRSLWNAASASWARGARGSVDVYHNATVGVRMGSTWRVTEYPRLVSRVHIRYHNVHVPR